MVLFLSGAPKTPPALGLTPVIPEEPDYSGYLYELEKNKFAIQLRATSD